ncbi:MAG: OmpA family protein, partial [Gammaproteobacteria bacterium]
QDIAAVIPDDIDWILRIDGHTDKRPINGPVFYSNWELSTARAISIVEEMVKFGIPARRMAATGFAEFHPVDPANTAEAYSKNRRIELKLTSR